MMGTGIREFFLRGVAAWVLAAALFLPSAQAAYPGLTPENHDASLAAGITLPSIPNAVFQNPAGLIYANRTILSGYVQFPDENFRNPSEGLALHLGDGNYGIALGVSSNPTTGFFGMGVLSPELKTSIGIIGFKDLSSGGTTKFNFGTLMKMAEKVRFGFTSMDFMNQTREWGLGIAVDLAPTLSLATDLAMSHDLGDKWVEPGIVARTQNASLAIGYGFAVNSGAASVRQVSDGVTLGLSIRASARMNFDIYYKKYSDSYGYYAGFNMALN